MEIFQIVSVLVAIVGALVGGTITIRTYRRDSHLKRAEWLYSLYEKFYEQDLLKQMRVIIDYQLEEKIQTLRKAIEEEEPHELVELLDDYLNFFEFIGSLWKLKQLSLLEIRMVFEYYVISISKLDLVMSYVETYEFENLSHMIKAIKREKEKPERLFSKIKKFGFDNLFRMIKAIKHEN